jgi:DNA-binding SARP family transcriptional activator
VFQVNLLGSFAVKVDGKKIHTDLGPSGRRLAAYLFSCPGKLHRRERIADLFWPELSGKRSRAALNSALWRIRKVLCEEPSSNGGGNLRSIGDEVVLEPEPWLQIDAQIITELANQVERGLNGFDAVATPMIRTVVDLYEAPLLNGEDDIFFVEERERVHTCFVALSHHLLARYRSADDYPNAIAICRKVLSFDPFREYFVRNLIGLLCLNEQRAEAATFFKSWQHQLRSEIGVGPMPETTRIFQLVLDCDSCAELANIKRNLHSSGENWSRSF